MRGRAHADAARHGGLLGTSCGRCSRPSSIVVPRAGRLDAEVREHLCTTYFSREICPGADAAGVRSRASVPVDLEPEQELRRGGRGTAGGRSSRASRCPTCCRASSRCPERSARRRHDRSSFVEDVIRANIQELFPGHAGQGCASVPRHPRRRPRDRAGGGRRPAGDGRSQPEAAARAVPSRCCRSAPTCRRASSTSWSRTSR